MRFFQSSSAIRNLCFCLIVLLLGGCRQYPKDGMVMVEVPAAVAALVLIVLATVIVGWIITLLIRPTTPPMTVEQVRMILQDADDECPPITAQNLNSNDYRNQLDAQRVYWKNAFISWVKRGL